MTVPAAVRTYDDYLEIIRARAVALKTTRLQIDEVAGIAPGLSSKILARLKCAGPRSFDALNGALGLMFIAVDDPEALARLKGRYNRRRGTRPAERKAYGDGLVPGSLPELP